jgi:hypothetical protein
MDLNQQKEQFSIAYVHALASKHGYNIGSRKVDDQSVDLELIGYEQGQAIVSPQLHLQLKCTESPTFINQQKVISYQLEEKNYNDLRKKKQVPHILVLLHVPTTVDDWLDETPYHLLMRYCAYWVSLAGEPDLATGQKSKNVHIPTTNMFHGNALKDIMRRIADGELP